MALWKQYKPWPSCDVIFKKRKLDLRTFDNRKQKSVNCYFTWNEITVLLQKQSCPFRHKCTAGRDVNQGSLVHTSYIQGCVQLPGALLWDCLSFINPSFWSTYFTAQCEGVDKAPSPSVSFDSVYTLISL